jgi:hypothetical protein
MVVEKSRCHSRFSFGLFEENHISALPNCQRSHSAADTKILNDTVFMPIGLSLASVVGGGRFIVQRDLATNILVVNFQLMVINLCLFDILIYSLTYF